MYMAELASRLSAKSPRAQVGIELSLLVEVDKVKASLCLVSKVITLKYDKAEA